MPFLCIRGPINRCWALVGRFVTIPVALVARYVNLAKILALSESPAMIARNHRNRQIVSGETEKLHFPRQNEDLVNTQLGLAVDCLTPDGSDWLPHFYNWIIPK